MRTGLGMSRLSLPQTLPAIALRGAQPAIAHEYRCLNMSSQLPPIQSAVKAIIDISQRVRLILVSSVDTSEVFMFHISSQRCQIMACAKQQISLQISAARGIGVSRFQGPCGEKKIAYRL